MSSGTSTSLVVTRRFWRALQTLSLSSFDSTLTPPSTPLDSLTVPVDSVAPRLECRESRLTREPPVCTYFCLISLRMSHTLLVPLVAPMAEDPLGYVRVLDLLGTAHIPNLVHEQLEELRRIRKGTIPSIRRDLFTRDPATRDALDRMLPPMPLHIPHDLDDSRELVRQTRHLSGGDLLTRGAAVE